MERTVKIAMVLLMIPQTTCPKTMLSLAEIGPSLRRGDGGTEGRMVKVAVDHEPYFVVRYTQSVELWFMKDASSVRYPFLV